MQEKNPFEYPCTNCPFKVNSEGKECERFCKPYVAWFKEEWRIVTEPFKQVARNRDYRKTHASYIYK